MKRTLILELLLLLLIFGTASFKRLAEQSNYITHYNSRLKHFSEKQSILLNTIEKSNLQSAEDIKNIKEQINTVRTNLKSIDFWLRYLEPLSYKKINGPLPIEWETEVFEKFEKPYKREGAGLTLATLYLEETFVNKDSLVHLIQSSIRATEAYSADSITKNLKSYHHFYLCNRLFLLNLATIYTTGFECPNTEKIIPELRFMLSDMYATYLLFNEYFPNTPLTQNYLTHYKNTIQFVNNQSQEHNEFDHFTFIKDYINPLFQINQKLIRDYQVVSKSVVDYSLNKNCNSIFSKNLYTGQNAKGIFLRVNEPSQLSEIEKIGKLLFYDPMLSANNQRSCASCHKTTEYFTDTLTATSLQFNKLDYLPRNTPSLINAPYNHLLMLDGKHISLQNQTKAVLTNPIEMAADEKELLKEILSCPDYKTAFKSFLKHTPQEPEITLEHVSSAITQYYAKFSKYYSPFDKAMNENKQLDESAKKGFNIFMSKAQCATCHFAPQFNGVKPPYVGSEFEVLGVPMDTLYSQLSKDKGRYEINPATETLNAFRTGSIRNAEKTKPYMHNGVFTNLNQVIDFYDAGGGAGHGLFVPNQTLSADSLHLTKEDKKHLLAFIHSLTEDIEFENAPEKLPLSKYKNLNARKVTGDY